MTYTTTHAFEHDDDDRLTFAAAVAQQGDALRWMFNGMREQAAKAMKEGPAQEAFIAIMDGVAGSIDGNNEFGAQRSKENGKRVACAAGCHTCCYQHLYITTSETIWIAMSLPADRQDRIAEIAAKVEDMTHTQRYGQRIPCPLLVERMCSVYDRRPSACRTYLSVSKTACLRDWRRRGDERDYMKHVPLLSDPMMWGQCLLMAADSAFMDAGLEIERIEIARGLEIALAPGAIDRWFAGEKIFEGHIRTAPERYSTAIPGAVRNFGDMA